MTIRWLAVAIAVLVWFESNNAWAQQREDRVIAGDHIVKFIDAINAGRYKLLSTELDANVTKGQLSVILIPADQPKDQRMIKRCFKVQSAFTQPDLNIGVQDYDSLLKFASDGVYARASALRTSLQEDNPQQLQAATEDLNNHINSLPKEEKESARRFAGALLADLKPTQPELAGYVTAYRKYVEDTAFRFVRRFTFGSRGLPIVAGQPYNIGSGDLIISDLFNRFNRASVQFITKDGQEFRAAWIGANFVFAAQNTKPHSLDLTGLGIDEALLSCRNLPFCSREVPNVRLGVRVQF